MSALENSGQAKTLSAPSLVVLNNQEAQINVGTQIPIVQTYYNGLTTTNSTGTGSTLGTTGSVQYLNTGVILDVKPRVNPGGLVYMDVQQEVSNPPAGYSSSSGTNPSIDQRTISSSIAVQSGETVMLGGLIRDLVNDNKTDVPLLGKIPVLKNLFGNTDNSRTRTELIVLLTPRVINNADEARQMTIEYSKQFESLAPLHMADSPASNPSPPSAAQGPQAPPATTYPAPENSKPQEEPTHDH